MRIARILACTAVFVTGAVLAVPSPASAHPTPAGRALDHRPTPPKAKPAAPPTAPNVAMGSALPAKPRRASADPALDGAWTVSLSASPTVLWPTQYATLIATANMDVGPTPYYIRIYDTIQQQYVGSCGSGTVCSVPVTNNVPTVLTFYAVVSDASQTFPPAVELARSGLVTVDWRTLVDKLNMKLVATPSTVVVGAPTMLTATTAEDVGPSPFYTQIYDGDTHRLLTQCGSGISCSVQVTQFTATTHLFAAYLAPRVFTAPDGNQQPDGSEYTAPFIHATWANTGWTVSLSAGDFVGGQQTFTATANRDVGPTPYYIEIYSVWVNRRIGVCGSGGTCTVTFASQFMQDDVEAFVTTFTDSVFPFPAGVSVQASSNVIP
jgi:hypothetical protein